MRTLRRNNECTIEFSCVKLKPEFCKITNAKV